MRPLLWCDVPEKPAWKLCTSVVPLLQVSAELRANRISNTKHRGCMIGTKKGLMAERHILGTVAGVD